jgi:hypothetical protein
MGESQGRWRMDAIHLGELEVIIEMVTQDAPAGHPLRHGTHANSTRIFVQYLLYMIILHGPLQVDASMQLTAVVVNDLVPAA